MILMGVSRTNVRNEFSRGGQASRPSANVFYEPGRRLSVTRPDRRRPPIERDCSFAYLWWRYLDLVQRYIGGSRVALVCSCCCFVTLLFCVLVWKGVSVCRGEQRTAGGVAASALPMPCHARMVFSSLACACGRCFVSLTKVPAPGQDVWRGNLVS